MAEEEGVPERLKEAACKEPVSGNSRHWPSHVGHYKVPEEGWCRQLGGIPAMSFSVIDEYVKRVHTVGGASELGQGKGSREGWIMFRENHVRCLEVSSPATQVSSVFFIRAVVQASFRLRVAYKVVLVALPTVENVCEIPAMRCTCPAGVSGACKHCLATLYRLWDLQQQGCLLVPPDKSTTDVPAYWMSSSLGEEEHGAPPLLWNDLVFVKHQRPSREQPTHQLDEQVRGRVLQRRAYEPLPVELSNVSSSSIRRLVEKLKDANACSALTGVLESNDCQSTFYRRDSVVFMDHPFDKPSPPPASIRQPVVDWPPYMLSPDPHLSHADLLQTLEGGCDSNIALSINVPALAMPQYHDIALSEEQHRTLIQKSICLTADGARRLEERTRQQAASDLWHTARSRRITASNFGLVLGLRPTTSRERIVRQLSSRVRQTEAMAWGQHQEAAALENYAALENVATVRLSGFVVDPRCCWLGASPDGIVTDDSEGSDGIVEIKCPFRERGGKVEDVLLRSSDRFLRRDQHGHIVLNRKHKYFYQIMGQMAIAHKDWCDFYVFTLSDYFVQRIRFEPTVWAEMKPVLDNFFFDYFLPSLIV